jgi:hypothetical protein
LDRVHFCGEIDFPAVAGRLICSQKEFSILFLGFKRTMVNASNRPRNSLGTRNGAEFLTVDGEGKLLGVFYKSGPGVIVWKFAEAEELFTTVFCGAKLLTVAPNPMRR